jgi:hypothetical protein
LARFDASRRRDTGQRENKSDDLRCLQAVFATAWPATRQATSSTSYRVPSAARKAHPRTTRNGP